MGEIGYIFNLIFTFPILNALMVLYHLFGDFGLSIVILTLIIKLVLFPLTLKQLKSMKAQQALQPQIAEIRKKYGKDQQAMLAQTQALYKEYGVNPVAGCLPLLVQMPVLYGLFFAVEGLLKTTSNLKLLNSQLYPFVPHFTTPPNTNLDWFTFINPHWYFSLATPDPTHILPILAGLATLIQMRMAQPKTAANTSGASDPSTQSMKMMQYVSPLIVVFFGWNYAAGLALYWTVSSIFQAVQQFFVTGWGSLMVVPDFLKNQGGNKNNTVTTTTAGNTTEKTTTSSRTYTGDQRRERELTQRASGSNGHYDHDEGDEQTGGQPHTPPARSGSGPSQYNRRRSRSSASARRRSTQRSRS